MLIWNVKRIFKKTFTVGSGKEITNKTKMFSLSILLGLIVSMVLLAIIYKGSNPILSMFEGVKNALGSEIAQSSLVTSISTISLAGIAVGVGFKTGLFNIGVSGQMIMGGMTAGIFALSLKDSIPNGVGQILIIIISVFMGALTASLAGILKSFFKIHEVVSTILINWIAFFYLKMILNPNTSIFLNQSGTSSELINSNYLLRIEGNPLWPTLIITVLTTLLLWVVIYKTKFGYKLKMTGLNSDASRYNGINTKLTTIYSMSLSGAISGLLGAVLYFGVNNSFEVPKADIIPSEGFDGIAIALIGFSNPILIFPVAVLFALIKIAIIYSEQYSVTYISLILGILMYISAIGIIFKKFQIIKWIRILIKGKEWNSKYEKYSNRKEKIDFDNYELYAQEKNIEQRKKIIIEHKKRIFELKKEKILLINSKNKIPKNKEVK